MINFKVIVLLSCLVLCNGFSYVELCNPNYAPCFDTIGTNMNVSTVYFTGFPTIDIDKCFLKENYAYISIPGNTTKVTTIELRLVTIFAIIDSADQFCNGNHCVVSSILKTTLEPFGVNITAEYSLMDHFAVIMTYIELYLPGYTGNVEPFRVGFDLCMSDIENNCVDNKLKGNIMKLTKISPDKLQKYDFLKKYFYL
jgi:hypothetical protein